MFTIRDFGNDRVFESISELKAGLRQYYLGRSVSLQYRTAPHGLLFTRFVDVREDGTVINSYGKEDAFDFNALPAPAAIHNEEQTHEP